jgi:hypothetical protein
MEGINFVELKGKIVSPQFKTVTGNHKLFKSKIAIPTPNGRHQYLKVAAWNSNAEGLNELSENTFIKVQGHIEERSYEGKCRHCGGDERKYWTEVIIDYFIVVDDE